MTNLEEITQLLKDRGFRRVSLDGPNKQTYIDENHRITVTVEEHIEGLTEKEEELIKDRLRELGYLIDE